jgi:hypothetical protein
MLYVLQPVAYFTPHPYASLGLLEVLGVEVIGMKWHSGCLEEDIRRKVKQHCYLCGEGEGEGVDSGMRSIPQMNFQGLDRWR